MTPEFETFSEARMWLLADAAGIAARSSSVVVVGGWCSVLNNHRDDGIPHPGTKDVDLLFEGGATEGALAGVVEDLMTAGYVVSAKHGFQLVRVMRVGARELAFSVDLLHPSPAMVDSVGEMFSKHVDLGLEIRPGVPFDSDVVSIGTPVLDAIFRHNLLVEHTIPGCEAPIRFLNDAGLIISKCYSASGIKRQRDSFDLFLTMHQPLTSVEETEAQLHAASRLANLSHTRLDADPNGSNHSVRDALWSLREWLTHGRSSHLFEWRVREQIWLLDGPESSALQDIYSRLRGDASASAPLVEMLDRLLADQNPPSDG